MTHLINYLDRIKARPIHGSAENPLTLDEPALKTTGWTMLASALHWFAGFFAGDRQRTILTWIQWASPLYADYHHINTALAVETVLAVEDQKQSPHAHTSSKAILALGQDSTEIQMDPLPPEISSHSLRRNFLPEISSHSRKRTTISEKPHKPVKLKEPVPVVTDRQPRSDRDPPFKMTRQE